MTPQLYPTPDDELEDGIDGAIERGWIAEVAPGEFSLTSAGQRRNQAEAIAARLTDLIDGVEDRTDLKVGLRMCALAMAEARDFLLAEREAA